MKLYIKEKARVLASIKIKSFNEIAENENNLISCLLYKKSTNVAKYKEVCDIEIFEGDNSIFKKDGVFFLSMSENRLVFKL
jgi:hypothetical protein